MATLRHADFSLPARLEMAQVCARLPRARAGVARPVGHVLLARVIFRAPVQAAEEALAELASRHAPVRHAVQPALAVLVDVAALVLPLALVGGSARRLRLVAASSQRRRRSDRAAALDDEWCGFWTYNAVAAVVAASEREERNRQRPDPHALSAAFSYTMRGAS